MAQRVEEDNGTEDRDLRAGARQLEGSVTHSDLQEPPPPGQGGRTGAILQRSPEAMEESGVHRVEGSP